MGIEKTVNAEGFFGKIQQALREGLGREMGGGGNSLGTVTLEVKDSRMERAEAGIGRAEAMNRDFGLRPGGGMAGNWDRPEDYPERDLGPMASSRWQSLRSGGAIHTMRNVGSFYQNWGGTLSEQDRSEASMWSAVTASPQGRKVEEAVSGMERGGKKMADLLKDYESAGQGTPAALRATEQMVKLQEAIEGLAKTAKEGAQAIGGERGKLIEGEVDNLSTLALEGKLPGAPGSGGLRGSYGDLLRLAHGDVFGAARGIFGAKLLGRLNGAFMADSLGGASAALGGGAAGAAGIGAMGLAALYGGFKAGTAFTEIGLGDVVPDSAKWLDDYRMSNSLGAGFSLRGLSYTENGMHIDESKNPWVKNLNMDQIRRVLPAMHIGAGGWVGGGQDLMETADSLYRRSQDMGVDEGALAGFVGQSIRSGETGRGGTAVGQRLDRIAGLIAEGNRQGISSNEYLGALASMRQAEMARSGFISQGGMRFVEHAGRILNATGNEMLKGRGGESFMEGLMNNRNPGFGAMTLLGLLGPDGRLNAEGLKYLDEAFDAAGIHDPSDRARIRAEKGDAFLAQALANEGPVKLASAIRFLKQNPGMNPYAVSSWLGQGVNMKSVFGDDALRRGGAPAGGTWSVVGSGRADIPAKDQAEAATRENAVALMLMTKEVLGTTQALSDLQKDIENTLLRTITEKDAQHGIWHAIEHPVDTIIKSDADSRGGRLPVPNSFSLK